MQTDKNISPLDGEDKTESEESTQEENLEWLLDSDLSEPEDNGLFALNDEEYSDSGLSEYEAEVAARPMFRGNDGGDDLANYVGEEIVISSEGPGSNIFDDSGDGSEDAGGAKSEQTYMAVDFTRESEEPVQTRSVDEGTDILGLANDDDMGETYMTIKRVKSSKTTRKLEEAPTPSQVADPDSQQVANDEQGADNALAASLPEQEAAAAEAAEVNASDPDQEIHAVVSEEPLGTHALDESVLDLEGEATEDQNTHAEEPQALELEPLEAIDEAEVAEQAEEFGDVLDYVAATPQPTDDEAFDDYLLQGEHLPELEADPEELNLESVDEMISVDLETEQDIDFAEEFGELGQADTAPLANIAEIIVPVIEEISSQVAARAETLQLAADAADVQVMLGADEASIAHCRESGYLPVSEVCSRLPQPLEQLPEEARDVVFVCITSQQGRDWNAFFNEDFDPAAVDPSDAALDGVSEDGFSEELLETEDSLFSEAAPQQDDGELPDAAAFVADEAFDEDVDAFAEELLVPESDDEPAEAPEALTARAESEDLEFDAAMADLSEASALEGEAGDEWLEDLTFEQVEQAVGAVTDDEAAAIMVGSFESDEQDMDLFGDDFGLTEESLEAERTEEAVDNDELLASAQMAEVEMPGAAAEESPEDESTATQEALSESDGLENELVAMDDDLMSIEGFGDDLFEDALGEDFAGDLDSEAELGTEIEEAFLSLEDRSEAVSDAICGVDVEEFAEEREELNLAPAAERPDAPAVSIASVAAATDMSWAIPDGIKFSYTSKSGTEIFDDFLDAFIEEGAAEVEKLEDLVSEWEKDVAAEPVVASVSRTLHTIKGIAKGVGLQRYGTLIHNFETLIESLPVPASDQAQDYFRIVNAWLDSVVRGIEFVTEQRRDIDSELPSQANPADEAADVNEDSVDETGGETAAAQTSREPAAAPAQEAVVSKREKERDQQLADEGAKALAAQQSVRITSEKLDHLLNLANQAQQLSVRASQSTTRGKRSTSELLARLSSVRTHIGKIADRALLNVNARGNSSTDMDALEMDQYSELQEAASILREGVEDLSDLVDVLGRQTTQVELLLKQQSSVISSISSSIQGARVVPVSRLMPGLRRIVRTVSTDLGKVVSFKVLNEIGALDRDHYARCQVLLEHMVRNALDHGIESPDDRLAAGKPTAGRITIDVRKSGGDYIIKLADDGRGIDPDAIRESAYEKGLDVNVDELSDDEAVRLIFHKGFSTASELSEISGRGVGMDIVLTELQQIGGDIQIQSVVGVGTSFEVRIPSNVTVNGALLVTVAENSYAIPLNGLIAVDQVPADEFFAAVESGGFLTLSDMDCEPAYLGTLCHSVGLPERPLWGEFVPVIIAGSGQNKMAIAVDNVQQALELVVRSLGSQFYDVAGVAGAATTSDGEALVALDLNLLADSVGDDGVAPVAVSEDEDSTLLALVVDDSRTQRMVATSQLDTVGVETVTAENGMVAIDLLNSTHRLPDVVLLDVEMPVKDGIETLREIRKSRRYGHLPVIMVTSRTGAKHRALAKEAGCNAYMGKPFNFPALIEQINELTGHELQLA